MVVGVVLDRQGKPICCELWPGNTADVKSLMPIVERLKTRFRRGGLHRGRPGHDQRRDHSEVEKREWQYILGVRMRSSTEAKEVVARAGRYAEVHPPSEERKIPHR